MGTKLTRQQAIDANCKSCIYDPEAAGTWRQQVTLCTMEKSCTLWPYRPTARGAMPESVLEYYNMEQLTDGSYSQSAE